MGGRNTMHSVPITHRSRKNKKTKREIVMKMKRNILNWMGSAALALATMAGMAACTDDLGWGHTGELGEMVHGTLSVQLGSSSPVQASRVVDFSENAQVKIDSYWVGVFDTKTGELLGTKYDVHPRKSDGTRWTLKGNDPTPFTVDDIDIYYYDHNPYVYIVGVVNFNDVMAKKPGEEEATTPVIDYLEEVKKLSDIKDIVIDTQSADRANRARGSDEANPIMMGFYSKGQTVTHPVMNPDGSVEVLNYSYNYGGLAETVVANISGSGADIDLSEGSIRLKRLLSEVNVTISSVYEYDEEYHYVPEYRSGHYDEIFNSSYISQVRYKVMNRPLDVFLVEHAVDFDAWFRTSKDDYLANTANSADFTDNFLSDEYWNYASYYYDNEGHKNYYFSYQHYENKHWGNYWDEYEQGAFYGTDHYYREKRYPDANQTSGLSDVYRALCPSLDQPWNNNGSYIVVEVTFEDYKWKETDVFDPNVGSSDYWEDTESQSATVYYIVHEGYTSVISNDGYYDYSSHRFDYQTQRNTQYFYNLRIGGAYGLKMNVVCNDFDEPNYHNDGITGGAGYNSKRKLDNTNKPSFRLMDETTVMNRKDLKWIYYQYSPGENGGKSYDYYFGNMTPADGDIFYYDSSEGKIELSKVWNPFTGTGGQPPVDGLNEIYSSLMSSVFVTKTNNIETIQKSYEELNEWFNKWESTHDPDDYPEIDEVPWNLLKVYPLQYFIMTPDEDPFLQLGPDEQFYYCFSPYLVTQTAGDDTNYEKLNDYKRQFLVFEPSRTDADGCTIAANSFQYVQYAYDDRYTLGTFQPAYGTRYHDYQFGNTHYNNSSYFDFYSEYNTYWCGAPGTVTWIEARQNYNSSDPLKEIPDYEITLGNGDKYIVPSRDVITTSSSSTYKYILIPVYIPEYGQSSLNYDYGHMDISFEPKPVASKYRPYFATNSNNLYYTHGIYMQRKRRSGPAGDEKTTDGTYQWLFADVNNSTYGYGKIWEFYNDGGHAYANNFEFGGLTIVNGSGDAGSSAARAIGTSTYKAYNGPDDVTDYDVLTFGGGYSSATPPSGNDKMMLKFWVDRPGEIYLSYGYAGGAGDNSTREWRATWRGGYGQRSQNSGSNYIHWPNNDPAKNGKVVLEEKGVVKSGDIFSFWPTVCADGRFEHPVEVCIFMASSAGYIRSIEFRPYEWDINPKLPDGQEIMPVPQDP